MKIFIDTSIYLQFYHFSQDNVEELKKINRLLDAKKLSLIINDNLVNEYNRNRENKIKDSLQKFRDHKFSISIPKLCSGYQEIIEIEESLKKASEKHNDLIEKLEKDIENKTLEADKLIVSMIGLHP